MSANFSIVPEQFPAKTRHVTSTIAGEDTSITTVQFSDKIMITISQRGRIAQWVQVPLSSPGLSGSEHFLASDPETDLLPMPHLTPRTLLGVSDSEREIVAQLYATQIGSTIVTRDPNETRTLMLGLGLVKYDADRDRFFDVLQAVMDTL